MNEFDNSLPFRRAEPANYGNAETAPSAADVIMEGTVRFGRHVVPNVIPFNGLLTNKLLVTLPGDDFARLLPQLEPISLVAGQELNPNAGIDFVYFPENAVISHLYILEDGSSIGVAIVGNEGIVGLSAILQSRRPSYCRKVTIGGSALRVRAIVIKQEFIQGKALQPLLLAYVGVRLAQLAQWAVCNGRHKLEERLCTWLLMIHDRAGEIPLPLTHEEIAHHLGARRAGITSACNTLRDNGIIRYHRGQIGILDRTRLEAAACECYRTLRTFEANM